jgi:hypothetical protein
MKKILALAAALSLTFALGVGAAVAAVSWPSTSTSWAGVNAHLNELHATQFSRIRVVTDRAQASGGNVMHAGVQCPTGWTATGGGFRNVDRNSATDSPDEEWFANNFSPTFPMGPSEVTPNGFAGDFTDSVLVEGEPLPIITIYAICVT